MFPEAPGGSDTNGVGHVLIEMGELSLTVNEDPDERTPLLSASGKGG